MKARFLLAACLAAMLHLAHAAPEGQAYPYRLVDLGEGYPVSADRRADVAGFRELPHEIRLHAARWRDGQAQTLSDLGFGSKAQAIAADGSAAGYVADEAGVPHAVRWSPEGERVDLGVVGEVKALGRAGTVVGSALNDANVYQGWQVDAQGAFSWLAPLPGDATALAYAMNHRGWIAGTSWSPEGRAHCVIWRAGEPADIGLPPGATDCAAQGINGAGHVAGNVADARGNLRAFLWRDGEWNVLGTLGGRGSSAVAVNDDDVVVGMAQVDDTSKRQHPFAWQDGVMTDLSGAFSPVKGVHLEDVAGIDAKGRITVVARSTGPTHPERVIRLVPTGQ